MGDACLQGSRWSCALQRVVSRSSLLLTMPARGDTLSILRVGLLFPASPTRKERTGLFSPPRWIQHMAAPAVNACRAFQPFNRAKCQATEDYACTHPPAVFTRDSKEMGWSKKTTLQKCSAERGGKKTHPKNPPVCVFTRVPLLSEVNKKFVRMWTGLKAVRTDWLIMNNLDDSFQWSPRWTKSVAQVPRTKILFLWYLFIYSYPVDS